MWPDGIVPDNKLFKRRKFPSELFVGAKPSLNFSVCLRMFHSRQDVSNLFLFAESFKRMFVPHFLENLWYLRKIAYRDR